MIAALMVTLFCFAVMIGIGLQKKVFLSFNDDLMIYFITVSNISLMAASELFTGRRIPRMTQRLYLSVPFI